MVCTNQQQPKRLKKIRGGEGDIIKKRGNVNEHTESKRITQPFSDKKNKNERKRT
jgi:hypothetical protein